jgi:predicted nuclease with TOPRIM domain
VNSHNDGLPLRSFNSVANYTHMVALEGSERDRYWKDKVESLIDEKKKWMKEKKELRSKVNELSVLIETLEGRNKHL